MNSKIRKLVSFNKLESSLRKLLIREYPDGFGDAVLRIDASKPFYAVLFDHENTTYLVKLNNYLVKASQVELEDDYNNELSEAIDIDDDE
ncbi:MAG: hypothetical protein ACI8XB_001781 [Patiriisocius sp.]|jgi:hypothetical protein